MWINSTLSEAWESLAMHKVQPVSGAHRWECKEPLEHTIWNINDEIWMISGAFIACGWKEMYLSEKIHVRMEPDNHRILWVGRDPQRSSRSSSWPSTDILKFPSWAFQRLLELWQPRECEHRAGQSQARSLRTAPAECQGNYPAENSSFSCKRKRKNQDLKTGSDISVLILTQTLRSFLSSILKIDDFRLISSIFFHWASFP